MKKILVTFAVTLGMLLGMSSASAYHYYNRYGVKVYVNTPGYYYGGPYYYKPYRYYRGGCRWIPGHYDYYGYWIPGHRRCW